MPRPEKVQAVEVIKQRLDEARATFVTEYRGLTVSQQQQLRRSVRDADGEYKVFKMSLARRASEALDVEGLTELLAGPTALAFAQSDPVPVARALHEFAKENESLVIKGGILAGSLLAPEQISRLAEIESRDVLLGKIAGGARAPLVRMAGLLGGKLREAASVFSQLLAHKEAVPVAEPEPAADTEEAATAAEAEVVAGEAVPEAGEAVPEAEEAVPVAEPEPAADTEEAATAAEAEAEAEQAVPEAEAPQEADTPEATEAVPEAEEPDPDVQEDKVPDHEQED